MMRKILKTSIAIAAAVTAGQASALTFTLNDTGGTAIGTQARAGFEAATYYWSSVLKDDVDVSLDIGFSWIGNNVLGTTNITSSMVRTLNVYNALAGDQTSMLDAQAVNGMQPMSFVLSGPNFGNAQLGMKVNATAANDYYRLSDQGTRFDEDGSTNNIALSVNTANMKALGLQTNGLDVDGRINFSTQYAFDFDPTDGIDGIDFIGVAIHEIGHALGFVSGVDVYDYNTSNVPAAGSGGASFFDNFAIGSVLDLFRYDAAGSLDWSTDDAEKYFSLDNGATQFGDGAFSKGAYNGDRYQASHWKAPDHVCEDLVGVLNPYICRNRDTAVTAEDLAAFDAIGWDLDLDVLKNGGYRFDTAAAYRQYQASVGNAVPEPATWAQMLLGFGLLGAAARRRRRATVAA